MTRKLKLRRWLISFCLLSIPAPAFGLTAEEVMEKVVENIKGPPGMTVVSEGIMRFSRRNLYIRTARYCGNNTEGFQIDILSPMEDQEVSGAAPQTDKRYRVVRRGTKISALTYLPSLRRGRKMNYVPLDGILGSDYPYYLLPLASDLMYDFSYTYVKEDPTAPVIIGLKREGSRSPYSQVELQLHKRGETYTVEKAVYEAPYNKGFTFILKDFEEFMKGYWAPGKVAVKETIFTFDMWKAWEPLEWLLSTDHSRFDVQGIPQL